MNLYGAQLESYNDDEEGAMKLIKTGFAPTDEDVPHPAKLARRHGRDPGDFQPARNDHAILESSCVPGSWFLVVLRIGIPGVRQQIIIHNMVRELEAQQKTQAV